MAEVMIKVSFFLLTNTGRRVKTMFKNLFIVWLLTSIFFGTKSAGKTVSVLFGIMAAMWVIRLIVGFGISLLPLIIVVVIFSKVVVPFVTTFLRHFQ